MCEYCGCRDNPEIGKLGAEHDAIVDAIEARDEELCDRLAAEHADQIVKQIQSYIARDRTREMAL